MSQYRSGSPTDSIESVPRSVSPALSSASRLTVNFYALSVNAAPVQETIVEEEMPEAGHSELPAPSTTAPSAKRVKAYCSICRKPHPLRHCRKFLRLSVEQRLRQVVKAAHCAKCLSHLHSTARCTSSHRCLHCEKDHNTLLHLDESRASTSGSRPRPTRRRELHSESLRGSLRPSTDVAGTVVLMPTVEVVLLSEHRNVVLRAVLDPCSVRSEISESSLASVWVEIVRSKYICSLTS